MTTRIHDPLKLACLLWLTLLALPLCGLTGCYDGNALIKQAEAAALNTTLAELDLGVFRTTLPRDPTSGRFVSVEIHIFGTVPRSKLSAVKQQFAIEEYRLRHEILFAVRQSTRDELTDPALTKLRARVQETVNKILTDAPVKEVGFYQLTLR